MNINSMVLRNLFVAKVIVNDLFFNLLWFHKLVFHLTATHYLELITLIRLSYWCIFDILV